MVIKLISESQEAKRSFEERTGRDWNRDRSRSPVGETRRPARSPDIQSKIPVSLPSSLTITTKTKELQSETPRTTSSSSSSSQLPLLHQMLTDNPLMGAAMQQMMSSMSSSSSPSSPSLPGLPSSADLLQQAHALQLLAQLQSVLLVNRQDQAQVESAKPAMHNVFVMGQSIRSTQQSSKAVG